MTLIRSSVRSTVRSPLHGLMDGKFELPNLPSGFVFIVENGIYLTRNGAYLIKAA